MKDNNNISRSAENVIRLSPPEIFETLLGKVKNRCYDEDALRQIFENSVNFTCDPGSSRNWNATDKDTMYKPENDPEKKD